MSMLLQCSNCAGSVTAADEAIRRGVVTCDYCHTVLRITNVGIETYKKRFLNRKPPKGIQIKRSRKRIEITVPKKIQWIRIPAPDDKNILLFAAGMSFFSGLVTWFVFRPEVSSLTIFLIVIIVFLALTNFLSAPPNLRLQDGILAVSTSFSQRGVKIPVNDFVQLYVTANRLRGKNVITTQYNLFVLKKDGTRIRLYNDIANIEAALYLEEWLEIRLGIFNLPVYGDTQTNSADLAVYQKQPDEEVSCFACTAPLKILEAVKQQGYITCNYCQTITLLYTQESHQPILGQPDPEKMIYRVLARGQFAKVLRKKEKKEALLLKSNKLVRAPFNPSAEKKIVRQFGIQKFTISHKSGSKSSLSAKLDSLEQTLAYTQDPNISKVPIDVEAHLNEMIQYAIVGQINGRMYPLIPNMEDLHEAAFIIATLNNFLESLSSRPVEP